MTTHGAKGVHSIPWTEMSALLDLVDVCEVRPGKGADWGWARVEDGHVVQVELTHKGLSGKLSLYIYVLASSSSVDPVHSSHPPVSNERPDFAELPESIGKLTRLRRFECYRNQLTSEFPRSFLAPPKPVRSISQLNNSFRQSCPRASET